MRLRAVSRRDDNTLAASHKVRGDERADIAEANDRGFHRFCSFPALTSSAAALSVVGGRGPNLGWASRDPRAEVSFQLRDL